MTLNEAYEAYAKDPSGWAKEDLGAELVRYCKTHLKGNQGDAAKVASWSAFDNMEDTQGDAILEIWRCLPTFDPKKSAFKTWVTTILNNVFADGYDKYHKRAEILLTNEAQVHPHRSIDEKLTMKQAIKTLSAQEQEFLKIHFAGFSDKAKGEHFGKNAKWSDNQLQIIKNKLRSFVTKRE
jgi:RNA polymerase sigma factor (sigma-70 family)